MVFVGTAQAGFIDNFDGTSLDPAWSELDLGSSTALVYTVSGGKLTVTDVSGTGWPDRALVRNVSQSGDFTASMDIAWDQPNEAMDWSRMWLLDSGKNIIAAVGLKDSQLSLPTCFGYSFGPGAYSMWTFTEVQPTTPAPVWADSQWLKQSGVFSIQRVGSTITATMKEEPVVVTTTGSTADVAYMYLAFGYLGGYGTPPNESCFGTTIVDQVSLQPFPIPEPGTFALLGMGLLAYAWKRRR